HIRTRAATDSYKNRIHKTGRPTPLMVNTHRAEQQRGLDLDVIKLTPMRSPKEILQIQENKAKLLNEIKSTKIISTVSKAAIIPGHQQLKPTNKKFAKGAADFAALESFLMNKISDMNHEGRKRDTIVDGVFKKSLQEFHAFLISEYSWVMNHDKSVSLKYEDMCSSFEEILKKTIKKERISASFPAIMGTNAFAGVLDEFFLIRSSQDIPAKVPKVHKRRHKKGKNEVVHNHHKFSVTQFSIPTFCEHCNSLIWVLEKGMVCQGLHVIRNVTPSLPCYAVKIPSRQLQRCLEVLIKGQVTKIRATLNDIRVLDKAADTANKRLSMLNLHKE
ncbi:predicted protein, partial [Nematostella vectensis]